MNEIRQRCLELSLEYYRGIQATESQVLATAKAFESYILGDVNEKENPS